MLTLHFDVLSAPQAPTLAPVLRVILAGPEMRTDPSNMLVAVYHNHFWNLGGAFSTSATFHGRCTVQFAEESVRSPVYGPADGCRLADGCLRLGTQGDEVLAQFDEAQDRWLVQLEGQHYPAVLIESA